MNLKLYFIGSIIIEFLQDLLIIFITINFFYLSKKINIKYLNICFIILFLIVVQGIIGWYMVKSGLINDTTVSHYRLSIHLSTAFFIISTIFWLIKNFVEKNKIFFEYSRSNISFQILILIISFKLLLEHLFLA